MEARAVDEQLCTIARGLALLPYTAPLNLKEERRKFFNSYTYEPQFSYRTFNPSDYVSRLKRIKPDDSMLGQIFFQTRDFLLRKLRALRHLGTSRFTDPALFGTPSEGMIDYAYQLLRTIPAKTEYLPTTCSAEDLRIQLSRTLHRFGFHGWRFFLSHTVGSTNVDPVNRIISINRKARFSKLHIRKLQVHEIGTHVLRAVNGYEQDYKVFGAGILPGYLVTEEGLASYHEKMAGVLTASSLRLYAGRLIACSLSQKRSFRQTFDALKPFFGEKIAWGLTLRAKRGLSDTSEPGGFFKDQVYLQGKVQIERYLAHGGNLTLLYAGKIAQEHAPLVAQGIIKLPKFLPQVVKK